MEVSHDLVDQDQAHIQLKLRGVIDDGPQSKGQQRYPKNPAH